MIKIIAGLLFFTAVVKVPGQTLLNLGNSVNDSSKVIENKRREDVVTIRLKTYAPCNGNLEGGVEVIKDRLNLKFWTKRTIIKGRDGEVAELTEVADCHCMFEFEYQLKGLTVPEKGEITVNGLALEEIDERNILIEMNVDFKKN